MNRVPVKTTAMSNLRRFSRSLAVAALVLLPFAAVQAEDTVEPSGYTPMAGESFFLLADSSFATDPGMERSERARLRAAPSTKNSTIGERMFWPARSKKDMGASAFSVPSIRRWRLDWY